VYESYFGFSSKPFSISPDPNCIYLNSNYREASALLHYGIYECKGIACLVGEVGTGKTMLLNQLVSTLEANVTAISVPLSRFTLDEIVIYLLKKMGIKDESSESGSRLDALYEHLKTQTLEYGKTFVVLVDEAQNLSNETLENLRLLSNLETPTNKLLHILLVGQPELRAKLNLPQLRQFKQRIAVNYTLMPLPRGEVPRYIEYRLASAGYAHGLDLFADDAIELVASFSRGIPRLINSLCNNALMLAFSEDDRTVRASYVKAAAKDLLLDENNPEGETPESEVTVIDFPKKTARTAPASNNTQDEPKTPKTNISRRWVAIATIVLALGLGIFFTEYSTLNRTESTPGFIGQIWHQLGDKFNGLRNLLSGSEPREDGSAALPSNQRGSLPITNERVVSNNTPNDSELNTPEIFQRSDQELTSVALISEQKPTDLHIPASPPLPTTIEDKDVSLSTTVSAQPSAHEGEAEDQRFVSTYPGVPPDKRTTSGRPLPTSTAEPSSENDLATNKSGSYEESLSERSAKADESEIAWSEPTKSDSHPILSETLDSKASRSLEASPVSRSNAKAELQSTTLVVKNGETITRLASKIYGKSGLYQIAAVQISNPQLTDLNVIYEGQKIDFPKFFSDMMIFSDEKGNYGALLGATRARSKATKWQSEAASQENPITMKTVPFSKNSKVYLIEISGFSDPMSLVSKINTEQPLKRILEESMAEKL
jgi:type II secretory pathway predicted ATPase ExeA